MGWARTQAILVATAFFAVSVAGVSSAQEPSENQTVKKQPVSGGIQPLPETDPDARAKTAVEVVLDYSLHGPSDRKEPGFLYFDEPDDPQGDAPGLTLESDKAVGLTPRLYFTPRGKGGGLVPGPIISGATTGSGLGSLSGSGIGSVTGGTSRISFNGLTGKAAEDGLSVAVTSSVLHRFGGLANRSSDLDFQLSPLDETVSLGLSLGYWGFNLDANVMRDNAPYSGEVEGIDLGLGYSWADFSTTVSVGEFRQNDLGFGQTAQPDDMNYYRMELGATYRLTRSLLLSGGVQHFEYGQEWRAFTDRQRFQLLYLSGQFRF